ncbi:DUF6683 family protein [Aquincola sp. J276]|uniref:DUF6683 family protein n=1 Tax=Aquincola sp. J276 TaxID=2898432 RepID=UPI002150FBB1|nr:DUF6683 family protein [Aquincola sp. J276]MCR5867110.1 hypothetical protein [Aquincola sp. J276]
MIRHGMRCVAAGLLAAGLAATTVAQAQDAFMFQSGVFSNMMMQPNVDRMLKRNMALARGDGQLLQRATRRGGAASLASGEFDTAGMDRPAAGGAAKKQTTVFKPAGASRMPALLAEAYPEAARGQAERSFKQLLSGYQQIERQFNIPRNDVAGAVAALLAGSWMAYRNADFPDENFTPLVRQMRGVIARNPDFAAADAQQKQEMYEQLAILGMLTATTQMALKENPGTPDAQRIQANLREAGKGYLEQFLKTDADRVQLTSQGLELR